MVGLRPLETIYVTNMYAPNPMTVLRGEVHPQLARSHHTPVKLKVPRKPSTNVATD